ncbi:hypothetical protein PGTUg99_033971 [Puccinia graminis f. sp. tritici]|uniref:Uncharacterized protein n=1 Tax=Puccinia graminis f. sp. tritici TaxID=56615 RepID=A0A5B0PGB2_PUCGR|nr:hypothetical protein PGTUg99_008044 [Puccinia graminis f. sp. tritici]KAA1136499.1 hypothetical protein PGTUg99_033971 [Puccinia graminis f. sp. tritici]
MSADGQTPEVDDLGGNSLSPETPLVGGRADSITPSHVETHDLVSEHEAAYPEDKFATTRLADPRTLDVVLAELKDINEKLAERNTTSIPDNHTTTEHGISVDYLTPPGRYFPDLTQQARETFMAMSFHDRALLCSTTIERNELYQETYQLLQAFENRTMHEVLENNPALSTEIDQLVEKVQRKIHHDRKYHRIQSQLLAMRIKRNQLEAVYMEAAEMSSGSVRRRHLGIQRPSTPGDEAPTSRVNPLV